MNLADISSAVQLALRRTQTSRPRSRSPTRRNIQVSSSAAPSSLSSAPVARARSKSPSRQLRTKNKSLLDLALSQSSVSAAESPASAKPNPPVQRVVAEPTLSSTTQDVSPPAVAKPSSPHKAPLRSNSPTLSYLILIVTLTLALLTPTCVGLPLGASAPPPASSDLESTPTLTTHATSGSRSDTLFGSWLPHLWRTLSGTTSPSTSGNAADPLESMVALFGPWDDDEWQHQMAAADEVLDREKQQHLDADEAWFHCGGKARFMAGLRNAQGEEVSSAPKCPKSQSTSVRVVSSDGNDKNRVHISSGAGLPVETAYLSAETLRGTLLYSRPAMVTPHTEL